MQRITRAFPISSRDDLIKLGQAVDKWAKADRQAMMSMFGNGRETWHYQLIEGKPYVIAVVEGEDLEAGFEKFPRANDAFSAWFKEEARKLTGIDLNQNPKGPESELVYEFSA